MNPVHSYTRSAHYRAVYLEVEHRWRLRWLDARMRLGDSGLVVQREVHARKMLSQARTRLKRATTILRKWERKVRYYERRKA